MRIAIISDIHANFEALKSVFDDIQNKSIDKIICLGDLIGYGPQPNEVVEFIRKFNIQTVLGNHDKAIFDKSLLDKFNDTAKKSLLKSKTMLSEKNINFIEKLPENLVFHNNLFVHGFPPNSIEKYASVELIKNNSLNTKAMKNLVFKVNFVGHTHLLLMFEYLEETDGKWNVCQAKDKIILEKTKKYVINVGSVGQPRDKTPEAKYVIFDTGNSELTIESTKYDIDKTIRLLLNKGFSKKNGYRLLEGK